MARLELDIYNIKGEDKFLIFMGKRSYCCCQCVYAVGEAEITDARRFVSSTAVRTILSPRVSIAVPQSEQDRVESFPWYSRLGAKLVDAFHEDPKLVLVQSGQDCIDFNYLHTSVTVRLRVMD
jgi:hypothetical protein